MIHVQTPAAAAAAAGLGGLSSIPVDDPAQSRMHLWCLTQTGMYLELRVRGTEDGTWAKRFFESPQEAAEAAQAAKAGADVYVGVLPRTHAKVGGDALPEHGRVLWCEADNEAALARTLAFTPQAHLVIRSSPGKCHAYFFLDKLIPLDYIERANKRLAYHLGCDPRATNAGRILRVAGSVNHKPTGGRVCITRYGEGEGLPAPVSAAAVVGDLPDPAPARPIVLRNPRPPLPPDADTDHLRAVPARVYIPRLAGREVLRGMAQCPFHADGRERTPSLSVGGPQDELFLCFGCDTGGDIFRFAALLWGLDERTQFREIKTKLKEML